jgi:hypothetical protein
LVTDRAQLTIESVAAKVSERFTDVDEALTRIAKITVVSLAPVNLSGVRTSAANVLPRPPAGSRVVRAMTRRAANRYPMA